MLTDADTLITSLDIFKMAALHKGLELQENTSTRVCSKPIRTYLLSDEQLKALEEQGFRQQARPDCKNEILTLIKEAEFWNFKQSPKGSNEGWPFDLRIILTVDFEINAEKGGVVLWPMAHSPFLSPANRSPHFIMFKTLVEADENALDIAKEIASSGGSIIITWTNIGLDGVRRIDDLFAEFVSENEKVKQLGRTGEVFDPAPYAHDKLFIIKSAQSEIVKMWREQLDCYRNSLVVQT